MGHWHSSVLAFLPDKEALEQSRGENIDWPEQHPEEMEEDQEALEALEHLGQGLLPLVARLQPGVDLVVPRDKLREGEEEGKAGSDGHPVQVVGELRQEQAGDGQEIEESPAEHEDKLYRRIISVTTSLCTCQI